MTHDYFLRIKQPYFKKGVQPDCLVKFFKEKFKIEVEVTRVEPDMRIDLAGSLSEAGASGSVL